MPQVTSLYVVGPLIAFAVVAALAAILRWTFDSDLADKQARIFGDPDDYGLLAVAAMVDNEADARHMQDLLRTAGIRSTTSRDQDGRIRVLVFDSEADAARRLVA